MSNNDEMIEFKLIYHNETDKAYLVSEDGERDTAVWVPKSQVEVPMERAYADGDQIEVHIPEWLAKKKDLL